MDGLPLNTSWHVNGGLVLQSADLTSAPRGQDLCKGMWRGVFWSLIEQNRSVLTRCRGLGARGGGSFFFVSGGGGQGELMVVVWADRKPPLPHWPPQSGSNHSGREITGGPLATVCLCFPAFASDLACGRLVDWPKCGGVAHPKLF